MKIDDVMELYAIPFLLNPSKRLPGRVAGKPNVTVAAALSCSVLVHVCAGFFFLHISQEPPVRKQRPLEVTTVILSAPITPITPVAWVTPREPKVARQGRPAPLVSQVPELLPVRRTQTAPVVEPAAAAPELKNVPEKTFHPSPAPATASREPAPSAAQAVTQPLVQHALAYGANAGSRGETSGPKDGAAPQTVTGPSFSAAYLSNPAPKYPAQARRLRLQGVATVRVLVSPEGRPMTVTLQKTSGTRALDEAALESVRLWSFVPARRAGKPVAAEVDVPLRFTLN